ncbi:hypothetical protein SHJG_8181 [Streptomyces hygroscopicus subsp. jinggangensis 5008]|nr:hypothetical protein SHJG_8181 [Streptomyces hygroscopicus subsp. jinggangensis 5008]AGF67604.1 hypothetical protein SHJGH_7942 [Streptomyces hygroscopicus subsp. jinggangensis TL01]
MPQRHRAPSPGALPVGSAVGEPLRHASDGRQVGRAPVEADLPAQTAHDAPPPSGAPARPPVPSWTVLRYMTPPFCRRQDVSRGSRKRRRPLPAHRGERGPGRRPDDFGERAPAAAAACVVFECPGPEQVSPAPRTGAPARGALGV